MASLLTVTGNRIGLEPYRIYTLGRALDCEIIVEDVVSSRHHARITVNALGSQMTIEDLGSQNGTYVNGRRIKKPWTLEDWSRIRIASTIYLLSFVESGESIPGGNKFLKDEADLTVAVDGGKGGMPTWTDGSHSNFAGEIGAFSLIDVMRVMLGGSPSGALHVAVKGAEGRIEVRKGQIRGARYQDLKGIDAIAALSDFQHGLFWFVQDTTRCKKTIKIPTDALLLDLACRKVKT